MPSSVTAAPGIGGMSGNVVVSGPILARNPRFTSSTRAESSGLNGTNTITPRRPARIGQTHQRRAGSIVETRQHDFLVRGAAQLPHPQRSEHRDPDEGQQHREHARAPHTHHAARTVGARRNAILGAFACGRPMSFTTIYKAVLV